MAVEQLQNELTFRVCYADTDAGGVMYYGSYFRYLEQGRTELLRQFGWEVEQLHENGILFPVREAHVTYKSSGRLGDVLVVKTWLASVDRFALVFKTLLERQEDLQRIIEAEVKNVCITPEGSLCRVPKEMFQSLKSKVLNE